MAVKTAPYITDNLVLTKIATWEQIFISCEGITQEDVNRYEVLGGNDMPVTLVPQHNIAPDLTKDNLAQSIFIKYFPKQ
jgi:hypothetical protein